VESCRDVSPLCIPLVIRPCTARMLSEKLMSLKVVNTFASSLFQAVCAKTAGLHVALHKRNSGAKVLETCSNTQKTSQVL